VIISVAPFFTAVFTHIFMKTEEKLKVQFFVGFIAALSGICLISFNGSKLELNPVGDILAILAALVWAVYSLLTRKISSYGYNIIQTTRRIFTYGILFIIPFLFVFEFNFDIKRFTRPQYALNLIFLGICASALCFVTWNFAVKTLGAIKTSVYIYMVPVITVITSVIALQEKITWISAVGTILTLTGLIISESKFKIKKRMI
ncbi:MAG: DMT family transporter, partial [Ruminococcus sp.]|nr:DMT family transporter [Ruminococcus sp.]